MTKNYLIIVVVILVILGNFPPFLYSIYNNIIFVKLKFSSVEIKKEFSKSENTLGKLLFLWHDIHYFSVVNISPVCFTETLRSSSTVNVTGILCHLPSAFFTLRTALVMPAFVPVTMNLAFLAA